MSEISDKLSKFGVKVLPDIKAKSTVQNSAAPVTFEMQQNATVIDIQSDSGIDTKTPSSFEEVDLSPTMSHQEKPNPLATTFKDNNMKTILVKGIQNLKDKLNNHIQKSTEKLTKEPETQKIESKKVEPDASPKLSVSSKTETEFKPQEDINLRLRSNSVSSNETDDLAAKKSKRKAPLPPITLPDIEKDSDFNLLNEIENEVNKNNYDCKDSDSETETDNINTIELNASHITVHHIPEESNRKAASLGDLSKITDTDSLVPLERAVSLELTEHTPRGSKKRKAPMPPEENVSSEELFSKDSKSDMGLSKLKKSSLFGTLEEAVRTKDDDNSSIISDTNDNLLTSSTPMKIDDDNKFLSMDSCSNISWELNFDLQDDSKDNVFLDDEKVPDLPTSPMPNFPTYVTEIKVSNGDESDMSEVNSSDVTLFVTAAEISANEKSLASETNYSKDESKTLEFIEDKTNASNHNSDVADTIKENSTDVENSIDYENDDSKDDSSVDTVKEITYTNGISEDHTVKVTSVETKNNTKNFKFSKENMSDEQILALNSTTPNLKYSKMNNGETPTVTSKIKSPNSMNKLPKLSQSVSPVKAAVSRIPVRANTEPSLKVSLINKDDMVVSKPRKYKLSEDGIENGKPVTFASPNHLPSSAHKTSVLSETRHNGPNR